MAARKGKRQAETTLNSKAKKISKVEQDADKSDQEEGLFDNLDQEMDPSEMENIMQQLNEESQSQSEEEEEEMNTDSDSEEKDQEENSPSESEEEEEEEEEEEDKGDKEDVSMAEKISPTDDTAKKFRDYYMTKVTQAFGSDLDQLRQEPTLRVPILIDSLEAGIDIYSNLEQEIILADDEN
ncbi:hypothetical protein K501DRAFT_281884 [Backusella circina FSU 941]|nr:hypothetical protein K501DRAFT_281884 [Backusella circina FSU 941]